MTHHRYAYTRMTTRIHADDGADDNEDEDCAENWQCGRETWVEWMAWLCRVVLGSGEARPADDKMELSGVK